MKLLAWSLHYEAATMAVWNRWPTRTLIRERLQIQ